MENFREKLVNEAKRIEEDSLYSAKGHFVAANTWGNLHLWLGIPAVVMAAFAGASALGRFATAIAGALAIVAAAVMAVTTFLNPNERVNKHLSAGNRYNSLRNRARMFWEIGVSGNNSDNDLARQLRDLAAQRDNLNQDSPLIPRWVFKEARKGIQEGEAKYEVDEKRQE